MYRIITSILILPLQFEHTKTEIKFVPSTSVFSEDVWSAKSTCWPRARRCGDGERCHGKIDTTMQENPRGCPKLVTFTGSDSVSLNDGSFKKGQGHEAPEFSREYISQIYLDFTAMAGSHGLFDNSTRKQHHWESFKVNVKKLKHQYPKLSSFNMIPLIRSLENVSSLRSTFLYLSQFTRPKNGDPDISRVARGFAVRCSGPSSFHVEDSQLWLLWIKWWANL